MGQKQKWIILVPDQEGANERRMKVRPDHLEKLRPFIDTGFLLFGGAFLAEPLKDGHPPNMIGSFILVEAETKEEVLENLKKAVYYTSEVWDLDKAQIYPYLVGVSREGMFG